MINQNENESGNEKISHRYNINIDRNIDTNIVNTKSVSVWWCNTKAELKKSVAYKIKPLN